MAFARGTTAVLDALYRDGVGNLVDPTNPLVDIINPSGVEVVTNATPTELGLGHWSYNYAVANDAPLGIWVARWSGAINGSPVSADDQFEVVAAGSISFGGDTFPCTSYATESDLCSPCSNGGYDFPSGLLDDMLTVASQVMYAVTGEQYTGECSDTVYPTCQRRGNAWPARASAWGTTGWIGSGSCCGSGKVSLGGYPVTGITSVTIDGEVLSSDEYHVEDDRWLVRTDCTGWPCSCDCDTTDAFKVVYTHGTPPPAMVVHATADLACQLALACSPETLGDCTLPANVSSITRQGVSAQLIPLDAFIEGRSGVISVDRAVSALNPNHQRGRSIVARADIGRAVRRITSP